MTETSKNNSPSNVLLETRLRRRERRRSFLFFLSIVLGIYSLINFYIFLRIDAAVPAHSWFHGIFIPLFLIITLAFLAGEVLEHKRSTALGKVLTWIGAFWLGAMTWFFLAFVILDFAKLIFGLLSLNYLQGTEATQATITVVTVVIFVAMVLGFFNARSIRVKPLSIKMEKPCPPLRIAAISDMHMGTLIGRRMVRQMVRKINSIQPDLVLMVGDQVDGNPHPVMQLDLGSELKKIESKYGVFAITGNHEYIGNAETSCAYLEAHGIKMLRDKAVEVAGIYLVGREDRAAKQFANLERKSLAELLAPLDKMKPIILLDHTPFHLEEAEQHGVDLQLSGHTHHAQIWPWNYITQRVYEVSWGYKRKGKTQVYVSCGAGTWGPPIRIGNTPEIMDISLS
ncbi:MAG: metallophosphoesterase [Candidatus Kapaibacterium sp.]